MNKEIKNKAYYQNTFDEVHASEDLLRKVRAMKNENGNKRMRKTVKLGYAAAAALLVLVSSNAIAYAATGSTWVEKVIVTINGQESEVEMRKSVDGNGNVTYEGTFGEDAKEISMNLNGDDDKPSVPDAKEDPITQAKVVTKADKVYLSVGEVSVDITEDIKDEKCRGTFELDGVNYIYEIAGTTEENSINISTAEE